MTINLLSSATNDSPAVGGKGGRHVLAAIFGCDSCCLVQELDLLYLAASSVDHGYSNVLRENLCLFAVWSFLCAVLVVDIVAA